MISKKQLAITLSKLKTFTAPSVKSEQYATDSEIAADIGWFALMQGDIEDKVVVDLGAGTGILSIAALLLGARRVILVDHDKNALQQAEENMKQLQLASYELVHDSIENVSVQSDVVIMNPPFGTKQKHIDKIFLEKAFHTAPVIYSIHKTSTSEFIKNLVSKNGKDVTHQLDFNFPIKKQFSFHRSKIRRVSVSCFRIV